MRSIVQVELRRLVYSGRPRTPRSAGGGRRSSGGSGTVSREKERGRWVGERGWEAGEGQFLFFGWGGLSAAVMGDSGGSVVSIDVERISFGGKVRAPLPPLTFFLESANFVPARLISASIAAIWLAALELLGRRIGRYGRLEMRPRWWYWSLAGFISFDFDWSSCMRWIVWRPKGKGLLWSVFPPKDFVTVPYISNFTKFS